MIDKNNILLITDNEEVAKSVTDKLVLLRNNDCITVCDTKNIKKALNKSMYCVIIVHEAETKEATIKRILSIKEIKPDSEIILLLDEINPYLILESYDKGIYDYFLTDSDDYEMLIKTINCFKLRVSKEIQKRNEQFLYKLGVIDAKTNLYHYKYLKEIFLDISEDLRVQNGVFIILTLDDKIKTKISTNRLAIAIKGCVRGDDTIAIARGGKFYMVLPNINLDGATELIQKIQNKMGEDFPIRAGLAKIGIQSFETLDKNAQDGLISAIQNEQIAVCLENNKKPQNAWLNDDEDQVETQKSFKLFKILFTNKMNSVITPLFYRYQREFESKLTDTTVSQYSNNIESVFCLKNDILRSELTIHYNGYAKFYIRISHSGLDSAENTDLEIPLSTMTEKYLSSLLKQLKDEYRQSIKQMKDEEE